MAPAPSSPSAARTLLTGPAGSGKTHDALERVKQAATQPGARGRSATRPGDVLLVLPTYAQAMHLARAALTRWDARAVLDDPFATFTSAGERYLDGFRVRTLPTPVERDALMEEALRQAGVPLFAPLADRPAFRARLLRFVKEAKQSGTEPPALRAALLEAAAALPAGGRARLLGAVAVFEAYDALLARADLEDHEDTLRGLADRFAAAPPARVPRLLVVDGFDDFTPVEMRILDHLGDAVVGAGGEVLVTLPWDEARPGLFAASAAPRAHLLARGFREVRQGTFPRSPRPALARLARDLFRADAVEPAVGAAGDVVHLRAGDPEDEAEVVARTARALHDEEGLLRGWRDLAVLVRRLDEAGPRLLAALERQGIPARLIGGGEPLAAEAVVRALAGPLRHLAGLPFDPPGFLPWLRWLAAASDDAEATARVDAQEIAWRRRGWPTEAGPLLEAAARAVPGAGALAALQAELATARGWRALESPLARAVPALVPLPRPGGLDPDGRPRDPDADRRYERARAARERVLAILAERAQATRRTGLDAVPGGAVDLARASRLWLDAIEHARFALVDRRLDAVNVLDFEEARFWEVPVALVVGLAEGEVPIRMEDDVLLGDDERETLREKGGIGLPLAADRQQRERRLFYGAVTRASRRIVLVRSCFDADGGPRAPSLYLGELERHVLADTSAPARPAGRAAPEEKECHTVADWVLFAARHARADDASTRGLARAILAREGHDLERRAARWRKAGEDPVDVARYGERLEGALAVVSAGALGHGLACRHRLFLARVAAVPEDDAPLAGPTFDARARGTLVHEALRRALRHPDRDAGAIAAETLAWAAQRPARDVGLPTDVERALLAPELERVVLLLRHREARRPPGLAPDPELLEGAFGGDAGIELAPGLRLRGQIDRVDRGRDVAAVLDYKLSVTSARSAFAAFREGLDVQLPLYALAVERLHDVAVVGIAWLAALASTRYGCWDADAAELAGDGLEAGRIEIDPDFALRKREAVERSIEVLVGLRAGHHPRQVEDAKRCGRCAWRAVCRPAHLPDDGTDADDAEGSDA